MGLGNCVFLNLPGDCDAEQHWRIAGVNERRKIEILGSMGWDQMNI